MRIYGPYTRKDGRQHIVLIDDVGNRRTVSYPKWLVEQRLGRQLLDNETVDHIDGNFKNNEDSNLQVLVRSEHAKLDASYYILKQEPDIRKDISGDDDIGETFNNGNSEGTRKGHRRD